jgi:arylsulfatase A-like enzyme
MAYIRANRISVGDHGIRSAFDVVPTIIDLTGSPQPQSLSGKSLLPNLQDGGESELGRAASVRPFTPYGDRKHFG